MRSDHTKKKLRLTTIVYWILLFYVIIALVWWFIVLYQQNREMYELRLELIRDLPAAAYEKEKAIIDDGSWRNNAKYIGEGVTFLVLILVGAVYLYRSVRRQFRAQQQQQNFVMAITHELKTPIAVSRLNLETMLRYQLDAPRKEKLLQVTLQEMLRLDALINNILIASQLDGRSYKISREELNFSDLVNDVFNQFATRYHERILVRQIQPDIDMNGDPLLLKLLISNLLENANKYAPRDKPVTVELLVQQGAVVLKVKDEGIGIRPEEKKNIFMKFYRVGNEETRTTKGTGLGLYLCKKIAEDHGGSISVEDNQPQGSKFIVRFPQ